MHYAAFTMTFLVTAVSLAAQSIHGLKWNDLNGNATRDTGEPGLAGVTIYIDSNNNGRLDVGEPQTRTMRDNPDTDFDETGLYWLDNLAAGNHIVLEVVPYGFAQTFPPRSYVVTLIPSETVTDLDFGNKRTVDQPTIVKVEKVGDTLALDVFMPSGRRYLEEISSDLKVWTPTGAGFN